MVVTCDAPLSDFRETAAHLKHGHYYPRIALSPLVGIHEYSQLQQGNEASDTEKWMNVTADRTYYRDISMLRKVKDRASSSLAVPSESANTLEKRVRKTEGDTSPTKVPGSYSIMMVS